MTEPRVRVLGADRLARTLRVAADDVADHPDLNARAARDMASTMSRRAPRRTGRLASSIEPISSGEYAGAQTRLAYAGVQEYGSTARHIPAQPYARPTLRDETDDYQADLSRAIQGDLNRIKGA